jgi:hypothetical protein
VEERRGGEDYGLEQDRVRTVQVFAYHGVVQSTHSPDNRRKTYIIIKTCRTANTGAQDKMNSPSPLQGEKKWILVLASVWVPDWEF